MHAHHMAENDDENKVVPFAPHKFWTAMYDSVFDHEVVGMQVRTPAPADKTRHAQAPLVIWLWMTKEAAKRDRKRMLNGQMIFLRRGQLATSYRYLATKANWTVKTVRVFLDRLAAMDMIVVSSSQDVDQLRLSFGSEKLNGTQKGTPLSIITICNYERYQHGGTARGTDRAQQGHSRGTKPYILQRYI